MLGAFIICIRKPIDGAEFEIIRDLVSAVGKVVKDGCGYGWDGSCLVLGLSNNIAGGIEIKDDEWEDLCTDEGFEWIDCEKKGRNEFHGETINPA